MGVLLIMRYRTLDTVVKLISSFAYMITHVLNILFESVSDAAEFRDIYVKKRTFLRNIRISSILA